jgi:quinol monooxygenase YgiN
MSGLIGKMRTVPGRRDALASTLVESATAMPGCPSYIVPKDPSDADTLCVTEVWETRDRHLASPKLPPIQQPIAMRRPLIADRFDTEPVGRYGLVTATRAEG